MYEPKLPPDVVDSELQRTIDWVKEELAAIALDGAALNSLELRTVHAAPTKPREGMIVEADGTDWNPGDGAGQYTFRGGVWVRQHSAGDTFTLANDITDEGALAYLDEVALSDMVDLQNHRVIGRNTAGTGVPEALSIETVLAWMGNTRGQVLRRGSSTWEALALGAAATVFTSDGTDAGWATLDRKWITELQTNVTTSGATSDFTDIDPTYNHLIFFFDRVSPDSNGSFMFRADDDNTFASPVTASGSLSDSAGSGSGTTDTIPKLAVWSIGSFVSGFLLVLNYAKTDRYKIALSFTFVSGGSSFKFSAYLLESTALLDNFRFGPDGPGDLFDAGKIIMGGIK